MRAVLFDLDGTLLPMDQDVFTKAYFGALAKRLALRGYAPKALIDGVWNGTCAMVRNDGAKTNEQVFWDEFARIFGESSRADIPYFDEFYKTDFNNIKASCGFNADAGKTVKTLRSRGCKIVVATNPLFPMLAQQTRLRWAGVDLADIDYITSYENSHYCKPNTMYYSEILSVIDCAASDCLMVGNDVDEDMIAQELGLNVFLLTDCMINRSDRDIGDLPHGGFDKLIDFASGL